MKFDEIPTPNRLLHILWADKDVIPRFLIKSHHDIMLQEITCCEIFDYREDTYGIDQNIVYHSDNIDCNKFHWYF